MTERMNAVKDLKRFKSNHYCVRVARTIQILHPTAPSIGHLMMYILLLIRHVLRPVACFNTKYQNA